MFLDVTQRADRNELRKRYSSLVAVAHKYKPTTHMCWNHRGTLVTLEVSKKSTDVSPNIYVYVGDDGVPNDVAKALYNGPAPSWHKLLKVLDENVRLHAVSMVLET